MTVANKRILVVDDDPTARLLFRAALKRLDLDVAVASSGEDGLRQFGSGRFDLVLLDIGMPDLDGFELCTRLRALADPLLPIMMASGMDDVQSVERAYACGATDFIVKPMCWSLIAHRVRNLLRSQEALMALRTAKARHAAMLQITPDMLFELDMDGRCVDFHSPSMALLQTPPQVFMGQLVSDVLPPRAARVVMGALLAAQEHGSSCGHQIELPLAQGVHWFEISVSRIDLGHFAAPHFMVLSRDLTGAQKQRSGNPFILTA
jgi:DNA-binding response OmpR family regulator